VVHDLALYPAFEWDLKMILPPKNAYENSYILYYNVDIFLAVVDKKNLFIIFKCQKISVSAWVLIFLDPFKELFEHK